MQTVLAVGYWIIFAIVTLIIISIAQAGIAAMGWGVDSRLFELLGLVVIVVTGLGIADKFFRRARGLSQ